MGAEGFEFFIAFDSFGEDYEVSHDPNFLTVRPRRDILHDRLGNDAKCDYVLVLACFKMAVINLTIALTLLIPFTFSLFSALLVVRMLSILSAQGNRMRWNGSIVLELMN